MAGSSRNGHSKSKDDGPTIPWRAPVDAVERPLTNASQSMVQAETFMDALSVAWRLQRRARVQARRGLGFWLGMWSLPSRGDIDRLSNQLANVERELRAVRAEVERSGSDDADSGGLRAGSAPARRRPASRDDR